VGTRNGLNRYDGHSFKVFQPAAGNSISNEVINCIGEDSRGRIWVGTMRGLNIYDPVAGKWEVMVPDADRRGVSVPNFIIWDLDIDQQDRVWIASDVFEFCYYDIASGKFTYYDWPGFARNHPVLNKNRYRSVQKFVRKNEHEYWLAANVGLVHLDTRTAAFTFVGGGYRAEVIDLLYDPVNEKVFLTAEGDNFFSYSERDSSYAKMNPVPQTYPSSSYIMPGSSETWLAADKGVIKISGDGKNTRIETNIPQLSASLLPGGVKTVFEDNTHIRWVGTANGISVYDPSASRSSFLPLIAASDKESVNRVGGVYYDDSSACYFVCVQDPAAVFIIYPYSGKIKKISSGTDGSGFTSCNIIKRDNNNTLWLLTGNNLYQYDREREEFNLFPIPGPKKDFVFRGMMQDKEGNYWIGSFNQGILFYNSTAKKFIPLKDSILNKLSTATGFGEYAPGNIIIGATFGEGVFTFEQGTGKGTLYYETAKTADYAQLNLVNAIAEDARGHTWLATYSGGLFRYNPGEVFEKAFTRFDMRNGLSSNSILSIAADGDTTLWLLTGKGITAVNTEGKFMFDLDESQTFGFSAYSSDSRYPHDIYYNRKKEELLVGAGGGLFIYSLKKRNSMPRFPVVITGVRVNGKELTALSIQQGNLRLPFNANTLTADFAGLYYGNEPGIQYVYKLEGYDTGWIRAGNSFSVLYQNLPSGNYRLRVRAMAADGSVAGETTTLGLRVIPPFWRTWWFVLLAILLLTGVIWWIISSLQTKLKMERIINAFATSLYGQNTTEDILWDTARNCIDKLGFIDCVIYLRNEQRNVLVQVAAYGPKNPQRREILNKIEIPVGRGIVGWVAQQGRGVIIKDTSKDDRYIVDDEKRLSEIAVPVMVDRKVFAVIDSEHPHRKFYTRYHLKVMTMIAAICAERVSKYLNEERLRAKIARDLHDEMGSTLTSINIISKVAMEDKQENQKLYEYFRKIKDHSGKMMESMSDMVWAINPVNDNFEKVILKMKEFVAEMLEPARINFHIQEEGPLDKTFLNPEQRRDIYLILKEAVNNIVKYSGATEMQLNLQRSDKLLKMMISDNGKGFDSKDVRPGNGLRNMHSRAEEMGATLKVETLPGKGTVIWLELPMG
jgi:signal transduction histidine kinase/ligand-binding sensor domain-containing protein